MMKGRTTLLSLLLIGLIAPTLVPVVRAEDGGGGDDDDQAYDDDGGANDDGNYNNAGDDDSIKYWTEYAVLPKRCIIYNNVDMIMFSIFEQGYNQCSDEPMGTYVVPVTYFVQACLDQAYYDAYDAGEDYEFPGAAQFAQCTETDIGEEQYWLQLGCSDVSSKTLAVNVYSDETCSTRETVDGWDDSNIDISELVLPFKECEACVTWLDKNDDEVDDEYYENKQIDAPLCSSLWEYKQECDRSCQKIGHEKFQRAGWNTSDKVLLTIMSIFGAGMLITIVRKRRNMSKKELLLEEAAMSAAGLQQTHIIGIFILVVIVIIVFALLGLKNITWALLLITNTTLFAYLMKLTVDSGMAESARGDMDGPDRTALPDDDHIESSLQMPRRQIA